LHGKPIIPLMVTRGTGPTDGAAGCFRPGPVGCSVTGVTITCGSCGQQWLVATTFSLYEQQTTESCPCPRCGAYTLCCHEAAEDPILPRPSCLHLSQPA